MNSRVLIVPGFQGSGPGHWQTWLESVTPVSRRVRGINWHQPVLHRWARAILREINDSPQRVIIVAHSFGCLATAAALAKSTNNVAAAVLVAPADPQRFTLSGVRLKDSGLPGIAPALPKVSLNSVGFVISSEDDPWMLQADALEWAKRWQLGFVNAGKVGHINVDSGHGPWPWIKQMITAVDFRVSTQEDVIWRSNKSTLPIHFSASDNLQGSTPILYA